ncbi:MAG TPA: LPS export ABC transporter ATP-binding protein [Gemmatimonadales bacterium]|nr:LPS export ABC transporter ATP-binding protein [Gemmatimonadales bacterium]
MSSPAWLVPLGGRDHSLPLALAAVVADADDVGRIALADLVLAYRTAFLARASATESRDLTAAALRESLTASVLPRLATDGWVEDGAPRGWDPVHARGAWWEAARADRAAARRALLDLAGAGFAHRSAEHPVPAGASILEGDGLVKAFRGRRVVEDVSVRVAQGEIVGLLGPNGAGKTTTFYMITGLVRPDAGRVLLDGVELTGLPMYRRARAGLGYLAQEPSIFRRLTVEENILAILETLPLSAAERRARLETLLDELSIRHLRHDRAYSLSGGERRRLEITRALVTEPKFMLLDEPFAGVDPIAVHDIQTIVAGLRHRGIGVLITDHNVEQTLDIVDRAYIMFEGRVQAAGTVRELVFDDRVSQVYLGPTLTARLRARMEAA